MSECNKCQETIGWEKDGEKWKPVNPDGSDHRKTCAQNQEPARSVEDAKKDLHKVFVVMDECLKEASRQCNQISETNFTGETVEKIAVTMFLTYMRS